MADRMMPRILGLAFAAAGLLATGAQAQAQTPTAAQGAALHDPMRPPSAAASGGLQEDAPAGRQLQSVLLSGGRKLAIIDGSTVPLGGRVGEARLVHIGETAVTLKTGSETEVLKLYPAIDKRPVKRAANRARDVSPGQSRLGGPK